MALCLHFALTFSVHSLNSDCVLKCAVFLISPRSVCDFPRSVFHFPRSVFDFPRSVFDFPGQCFAFFVFLMCLCVFRVVDVFLYEIDAFQHGIVAICMISAKVWPLGAFLGVY